MRAVGSRLVVLATVSCVIPDRDIGFEGGPTNPSAVRIIEQASVPMQWDEWCLTYEEVGASFCPSVPTTRPSGLIRPNGGPLCVCPDGQRDLRAPALWTVYAEVPDLSADATPDTLYGVLLMDPDPTSTDPGAHIAYENYLEPCAPGVEVETAFVTRDPGSEALTGRVRPSSAHNAAPQWAFRIDDAQGDTIDLCNDDNGTALDPGLHNLQLLVTDRAFFSAPSAAHDGFARLQCAVPDLAAGASYAAINYVFECTDGTAEDNDPLCACGSS